MADWTRRAFIAAALPAACGVCGAAAPPAEPAGNSFWLLAPGGGLRRVELKSVHKGDLLLLHTPEGGWMSMRVTRGAYFDEGGGVWTVEGDLEPVGGGGDE